MNRKMSDCYCELCEKEFASNKILKIHFKTKIHKKKEENLKYKYQCEECEYYTNSSSDHNKHLTGTLHIEKIEEKIVEEKKYKYCQLCDLYFKNKYTYELH